MFFKSDRLYRHNIMRINYTTYDTRQSQDVINPSTSHRNIMVLNASYDDHQSRAGSHPFCYAQVLGIYHANVVYTGREMINYTPNRMEFLWVRWYQLMESTQSGWNTYLLDRLQFAPMAEEDAFGFIDPLDVVRGCHIIHAFAGGTLHADGRGLSYCAQDSFDWVSYYVNRCVSVMSLIAFSD
jgi:hypothetical protein